MSFVVGKAKLWREQGKIMDLGQNTGKFKNSHKCTIFHLYGLIFLWSKAIGTLYTWTCVHFGYGIYHWNSPLERIAGALRVIVLRLSWDFPLGF